MVSCGTRIKFGYGFRVLETREYASLIKEFQANSQQQNGGQR